MTKIRSHLKYNNDIKLTQTNAHGTAIIVSASSQWEQQLGIGVIVDF